MVNFKCSLTHTQLHYPVKKIVALSEHSTHGWAILPASFWFPSPSSLLIPFPSQASTLRIIQTSSFIGFHSLSIPSTDLHGANRYWCRERSQLTYHIKARGRQTANGKVSQKATFIKQSSHSVIMLPQNSSSVDWIAVVTARSVLFPAELMEVGSRHQAESKPRVSEKMQKPVYLAISQSNM